MALRDENLYSLTFVPSGAQLKLNENASISSSGDPRYVRILEQKEGEEYSAALYDALSGARLASTGYILEKLRSRRLELHGPDEHIPFEFTGKLGFEWTFTFEDNKYKWKRAGGPGSKDLCCVMKRGGDPDVEICLYRPGNVERRSKFQILHYNLERFFGTEIKDARGLETVLTMSCVALEDAANNKNLTRITSGTSTTRPAVAATTSSSSADRRRSSGSQRPPVGNGGSTGIPSGPSGPIPPPKGLGTAPLPPSPPQQLIETLQEEEPGEVLVGVNTDLEAHIDRANRLLADDNVLFIIIRSRHPAAAMRATEVSLGVQRHRHRNMLPELHRYMSEEDEPQRKGPRVINLDDPASKKKPEWKPPTRLAIYLSRIELPDLAPKTKPQAKTQTKPPVPANRPPAEAPSSSGSKGNGGAKGNGSGHSGNHLGRPSTNGHMAPGLFSPSPSPRPQQDVPPRVPSPAGRPVTPGGIPPGMPPGMVQPPYVAAPQPQPPPQESRFSKLLKPSWK